jgi:hypothetical protein
MKETNQAPDAPGTLKNGNDVAVSANDGFTTMKRKKAKIETSTTSSHSLKKNKQTKTRTRISSSLHPIVKRVKIKSRFVVRFALEVSTTDTEKSV